MLESMRLDQNIPRKANHVLHLFLIALLLMLTRIWYLSTIKHDDYLAKARKPQRRVIIEQPHRGTIRDRFNIPLAMNQLQYNVAILYSAILEIPSTSWSTNEQGVRKKVNERREHVQKLTEFLAKKLNLDPSHIRDIIYSKASLFPNTPFVIAENLTESLYYELKFAEREWPGLRLERAAKRVYPKGKVASNIIGYLGDIDPKLYYRIAGEIDTLKSYLEQREEGIPAPLPKGFKSAQEAQNRFAELKEKMYTMQTQVGRAGIERRFDENLRGLYGKKPVAIGPKGKVLNNLPGARPPISGQRIILTLSSELQECAENLLILNEKERDQNFATAGKRHREIPPPWMKGGAIVAMIPQTGEVVALASYPRFDPNDFIKKESSSIQKWLETPNYFEELWQGIRPIERECLLPGRNQTYQESSFLTWDLFLDQVLSKNCAVKKQIQGVKSVREALNLLQSFASLIQCMEEENPRVLMNRLYPEAEGHHACKVKSTNTPELEDEHKKINKVRIELDPFLTAIPFNEDKLLFLDLLRLVVDTRVIQGLEECTLGELFRVQQLGLAVRNVVHEEVKTLYHERVFPIWRATHFKSYLSAKREEEKLKKTYVHPYTEYLEEAESKLLSPFWQEHSDACIETYLFGEVKNSEEMPSFFFHLALNGKKSQLEGLDLLKERVNALSEKERIAFFSNLRSLHTLQSYPLWGHYPRLPRQTLKDLAKAFYPKTGMGYGKSYAYSQAAPPGSWFKLVTAYEAFKQTYFQEGQKKFPLENILTIYDEANPRIMTPQGMALGRTEEGKWITRRYKGGRLPKTHSPLGKINFYNAIERSSNIYFSLLASDFITHPRDLYQTTRELGAGTPTGIELTGEIGGYVPDDICDDRSSLYSFAIGQHALEITPLQSSVMLSTIANGGEVLTPQIVKMKAGSTYNNHADELFSEREYPYNQLLKTVGLHFPLFTESKKTRESQVVLPFEKKVKRQIALPDELRAPLVEGMRRVVWGENGQAAPHRIRSLYQHPEWMADYKKLTNQFTGKTSTTEFRHKSTLDRETPATMCKDIWFGSISFKDDVREKNAEPELVVVVYLRYGSYGKEAAPLAAQIVKKWREINSNLQGNKT